jgi:hypothetical protein
MLRDRNPDLGEPLALPSLGRGMIHLEDANATWQGCSISIGVESCAEHHDLSDTTLEGSRQAVFSEACSHSDEQSQPSPGWVVLCSVDGRVKSIRAQNASGQGIGKNIAAFQDLMSSAVKGGAQCGLARLSLQHGETHLVGDARSCQ